MIHATIYAVVGAGLIALNITLVATTNASFFWFPFPLVGWGCGVMLHYLHGVLWAEREIRARQRKIERLASETPSHAGTS